MKKTNTQKMKKTKKNNLWESNKTHKKRTLKKQPTKW